jgi:DNA mismatch endonuclease (patch repair protein)
MQQVNRMMKSEGPTTTKTVSASRSAQMALVRSRDTKPELLVRRALHAAGLRYRLHAKDMPGKPDIVFRRQKVAVFVHGCFWHRHDDPNCKLARLPKSRREFWEPKLLGNRQRDIRNTATLVQAGWRVVVIWECDLTKASRVDAIVSWIKAQVRGTADAPLDPPLRFP